MTRRNLPAFGAVRISPDGEHLAWHRPESDRDPQPWLLLSEDADALGVEHEWASDGDVAHWTDLQAPAVTRADDARDRGLWLYQWLEPRLYTVGFYRPDGTWVAESDHDNEDAAAARVHWLNGSDDALVADTVDAVGGDVR